MEPGRAHVVPVTEGEPTLLPSPPAALLKVLHEPALFVRARDRTILDANAGFERLFGHARAALLGKPTTLLHVSPASHAAFGHAVRKGTEGGASFSLEWTFQRASGERFLAEVSVAPATDADGTLLGWVGTIRDLTRIRRAQARGQLLAEASAVLAERSLEPEAILRNLARLATRHLSDYCAVEIVDDRGNLRRVEVAHADPSRDADLRSYLERFPPPPEYVAKMREIPRGGCQVVNDISFEAIRAFLRDDTHADALASFRLRHSLTVPLHGRDRLLGLLAFSRSRDEPFSKEDQELAMELCARASAAYENAHLHEELERKARATADAEARWRSLVEHASDWVYLADKEGRVLFINRVREGTTVQDVVGRRLYDWLTPTEAARVREVYDAVFRTKKPGIVTTTTVIRGRTEHYEMRIGPVIREGEVVAATVTTIDVTQQRRQERVIHALHDVQTQLAQNLDLDRLVQAATDAATSVTGAAFGAFFYNVDDDRGGRYTLYALSGVPREAFSKFPMPRNTAVFAPTFTGTSVVRSDDITADPRYGRSGPHHGMPAGHLPVRSYLAVPVVSRTGEVHGGLFFGHPEKGRFDAEAESIATSIASQAAIALDNAHLYRRARENEERLREREAQLAQAQRLARLGSWSSDIATGELEWSDENYHLHGIPLGERVTHERMLALVHPEDRARVVEASARILEQGEGEAEYRLLLPDGSTKHVHGRGRVIRDEQGRPVRGVGTTLDITERKSAELALAESENRFRTLVHASTQMVWHTDANGNVIDMPEWREYTGQTVEEVRGSGWLAAIHPDDLDRVRSTWRAAFDARGQYECEYRVRNASGNYRWFFARGVPRFDPAGRLVEYIGTWTDVTERRIALQEAEGLRLQLAQSEKLSALGSLVGGVAHEIRTPLTYLANNLALIEIAVGRALRELPVGRATEVEAKLRERLADAQESVERIDRIVEDLRRYTKLKANTERKRAPLSAHVADAIALFRATHKGEIVVLEDLRSTSAVIADRVQMQQVLLNFLQNAYEAKPADDRVRVRTYDLPGSTVLEVEDKGNGIPPDVLTRMWDPFFTTKSEGSGLGLAVVRRILDTHGATVDVKSEVGVGTTFRVTFPSDGP